MIIECLLMLLALMLAPLVLVGMVAVSVATVKAIVWLYDWGLE